MYTFGANLKRTLRELRISYRYSRSASGEIEKRQHQFLKIKQNILQCGCRNRQSLPIYPSVWEIYVSSWNFLITKRVPLGTARDQLHAAS